MFVDKILPYLQKNIKYNIMRKHVYGSVGVRFYIIIMLCTL